MSLLESVGKPTFSLAVDKIFCQCLKSVWNLHILQQQYNNYCISILVQNNK